MNVMMLSFSIYSGFLIELSPDNAAKIAWPMSIMTAVVIGYGGYDFFRKSFAGLLHLAASMETLIVVGSSCAFILSLFNQFAGSLHLYYDTACMLITLVLLGKTLEGRAKRRVLEDLESFNDAQQQRAEFRAERSVELMQRQEFNRIDAEIHGLF